MEAVLQFLIDQFPDLMNINLTATIVILFVICVRQFLKRAPKTFSYALWGIVLLRLLVPISIESPVSFLPEKTEFSSIVEINEVLPEIIIEAPRDQAENPQRVENAPLDVSVSQDKRSVKAETYLTGLWLAGIAVMLLQSLFSYWKLRRRVRVAVPYRKGIYIADDIATPFLMGILHPVIYLPANLEKNERKYIIAHERHHIRRGDHIFKALGYLALTIHWFNPIVWLAFVLAGRDMEMSCDEAVIRKLGEDVRAEYAASLLNLATGQRLFTGSPLAFDEGDPTGRVRNLAKWKKPALWVILICVVICVALSVCLLTDPGQEKSLDEISNTTGPASVIIGDLEFTLPEGFSISARESDLQSQEDLYAYEHVIRKNGTIVGGVYKLKVSDPTQETSWDWFANLIPENVPEDRLMMSVEYSWNNPDVPYLWAVSYGNNGTIETNHYIFNQNDPIYDMWFDMTLLTEDEISLFLESAKLSSGEEDKSSDGWGVFIKPDRVSRTGATALFVYSGSVPGEEGAELTYGDLLTLDRLVDSKWVPCDELAGYDYFVGDSSYPVVDGYGMVHEWQDRFGELLDGHYRLGKQVTLTRPDGSQENRMVYGEFTLPDAVQVGPIPLDELPENYGAEQAMIDGCLVSRDGDAMENIDAFRDFYEACYRGEPGFFRTVNYNYGDDPHHIVKDIHFDGSKYLLSVKDSRGSLIRSLEFRHLKYFSGEVKSENVPYYAFECYLLVYDNNITLDEISDGVNHGQYHPVFVNYIYYPKTPQLPANPSEVILEFEGKKLVTISDFDRLEKIWILFQNAEFLGYEPKTHSIGIGLNLVLTGKNGESITIELDPESDICRINGEYVFYGAFDEPEYIEKLWYYLDIPAWPDIVYSKYPNALRPQ